MSRSVRATPTMTKLEKEEFEKPGNNYQSLWPEIGSRALLRASGKAVPPSQVDSWLIVQPDRYGYMVD